MKKLVLSLVLVAGLAFAANAQQGGQGGGRPGGGRMGGGTPEERVKKLDEKVKLTDDQKTKATAVYTAAADEMKKAREEAQGGGGDRQAMMEKFQKMNAETDSKLTAILTEDQKKAYKTWQEEQKAEREKRMKERQAGGGGQ